jgi:hypothetical protein
MAPYFMIIIFAITGIIALLAALFNWGWFFTAQNAQYVVKLYGRQKARFIYGALGLVLILMAVYFYLNTPTS